MNTSPDIRLLDESAETAGPPPEGFVRRQAALPVRDDTLDLVVDVPDRPMRLAEIVPLVCDLDDRLMAIYLRQAAAQGRPVFCEKGCSVCCHCGYLILYSPAEMYYLMEALDARDDEWAAAVRHRLDEMAAAARQSGLIERLHRLEPGDRPLDIIEQWWIEQDDHRCPFLADGICSNYPRRFIACREHYSHAPPKCCEKRQPSRVPMPLNLINALWQVEQELTGEPGGALSLPLMALWAEARQAEARRSWPAVEMVDRLLEILERSAAEAALRRGTVVVPPRQ